MKDWVGKFLYGSLFCFLLPYLLFLWAKSMSVDLPLGEWYFQGLLLMVTGVLLMLISMYYLWTHGKGLPMNAYPTKIFVSSGPYSIFKHPIYVGFCICCFGISAWAGSSEGFYVVSPVVVLFCIALVMGYEAPALQKRFSSLEEKNRKTGINLWGRISMILPLFLTWLILYEILIHWGISPESFNTVSSWEANWPVIEELEIIYILIYPVTVLVPLLITDKKLFNQYKHTATCAIFVGFFIQWMIPNFAKPRSFEPTSWLGDLIMWERTMDSPSAALPSFHVLWACISAFGISLNYPKLKQLGWLFAVLISISCIGVGVHGLIDVITAWLVFISAINLKKLMHGFNRACENLANKWREWRMGSLRIINHAFPSAAAAFLGTLLVAQMGISLEGISLIVILSFIGAILWAQLIEGSSRLMRPFGYFGSIIGGFIGIFITVYHSSNSFLSVLACFALAAPWTQAIGRLRCLIQGCCHGSKCKPAYGIIYTNPHSRVVVISKMAGSFLYNTQGFSIMSNIIIGLILLRLDYGGATDNFIAGYYFILSGCSRFIEESYRGEPQTKLIAGLKLYQWLAMLFVICGVILTTISSVDAITWEMNFSLSAIAISLLHALLWAFGMSMDFPKANFPFSRLTG
jgi:protein-S-isoprenylcysteine O-methyltransferase Ste14